MTQNKRKNIDMTVVKGVIILVLTVLMLIPITMVQSLIEERASQKDSVAAEITSVWGGQQLLTGPILVIPYEEKVPSTTYKNNNGKVSEETNYKITTGYAYFMPDT